MSDLITTAQDAAREAAIATYFGVRRAGTALAERAKDSEGQTAAEYMGVLLLVAAIIAAIIALHVPDHVASGIDGLIDKIKNTGSEPAAQGGG
jgi:hypothetical protein